MLQHVLLFPVRLCPLCRCQIIMLLCCSFLGSRPRSKLRASTTDSVVIGTFETMATARPRLPSAVRSSTS